MKILFITSYYSALKNSIEEDSWNPTGMPAIVKLFEGLKKRNIDFEPFFIDRNSKEDNFYQLKNKSFNTTVSIFKISKKFNIKYLKGIGKSYNSLLVYNKIKENCRDYDLIYVDRANLVIGAFFAFLGKKVVLRLHGVTDFYENFSKFNFRLMNPLKLLCLRAPFKNIICSEDGSPGKQFLKKYTKSNNFHLLLNGVDKINHNIKIKNLRDKLKIKENLPVFLFLSRLSKDKGILEFLNAVVELQRTNNIFHTIIVGDGECYKLVKEIIKKENLKNISLVGSVSHNDVYSYFDLCDVYISLNLIGNLSNSVLEAVNAGKCIIVLKKSKDPIRDISTNNFFKKAALYIDRKKIKKELKKIIYKLVDNTKLIEGKSYEILKCKSKLQTWDQRIEQEIRLLTNYN